MKDYFICPDCGHTDLGKPSNPCIVCRSTKTSLSDHEHLLQLQEMTLQLISDLPTNTNINKSTYY